VKKITLFLVMLFLSSCSTITPQAPVESQQKLSWQAREQILSNIQSWQVNGKIAVRTARDSGSASIDWKQQNKQFNIALLGPLGSNAMTLQNTGGKVSMRTADGKEFSADSAEQLLAKQWGFNLPVSYLRYWIRGLPVPGIPHQDKLDEYNRLASFSQQGYNIEYLAYSQTNKIDLPSKLTIESPSLKTKIMIYKWRI
jgi:outer membrane lipoprotein LolB